MNATLLDLLRCPFCGGPLTLHETPAPQAAHAGNVVDSPHEPMAAGKKRLVCSSPSPAHGARGLHLPAGILCCQCCAYPVVAGIPYLRTGAAADTAMRQLGGENHEDALYTLLGLPQDQRESFHHLVQCERPATFRDCLAFLCPGPEGDYLFHRFCDPTFLCGQRVLQALAQAQPRDDAGMILDLCGGTGHLTRSLCEHGDVALADLSFAKLWLAKRFIAPRCQPVCCSAADPLPFARAAFSLVVCADALHYIWPRRLLADEIVRLLSDTGTAVLPHLHNLLAENYSAGMPLTPAAYRDLFDATDARLFKESAVLDGLVKQAPLDFSADCSDVELTDEAALVLIATRRSDIFRKYDLPPSADGVVHAFRLNPLYAPETDESWKLRFPSQDYEAEYAACRRYLPERISVTHAQLERWRAGGLDGNLKTLADRRVLLDLPERYL